MQAGIDSCDAATTSSPSFSGVTATMHQSWFVLLLLAYCFHVYIIIIIFIVIMYGNVG